MYEIEVTILVAFLLQMFSKRLTGVKLRAWSLLLLLGVKG